MKVKDYIKFLQQLPKNLDIDIIQHDCGGYDCELSKATKENIIIFEFNEKMFFGTNDIIDKWKNTKILFQNKL